MFFKIKKQYDAHTLLICPWIKFRNEEDEFRSVQFGEPPILSPSSSDESSSSSHIHALDLCSNIEGQRCQVCSDKPLASTPYYSCTCKRSLFSGLRGMGYHKKCIEPISKHPYHPKHSLRFQSNWLEPTSPPKICVCCSSSGGWIYNCSICNFIICPPCAKKPPVLKIKHPKRHGHTLFYFPRTESLTCDICGLSHQKSLIYSCHQCVFVVHKECAYLPKVIQISRHEHRLSFNSSLTPEKWLCGVCRGKIDTNYGRYTCMNGCSYCVHSKCATREDIWDGIELEGKSKDLYEDVRSFIEIGDEVIQHFVHQNHQMRLEKEINREFGENKRCQLCTLPICDDIIYSCMQCDDFILHQTCARLPRKKKHPLHPHPISLLVDQPARSCSACHRQNSGFQYNCNAMECMFGLDICCASVSEPFDYQCHPHSLFFISQQEETCSICQKSYRRCLNCRECGFDLCLQCATLPNKLRYKHDEHFLILSYDENANGQYWCDICEKEANAKNNCIYMCYECDVALHSQCILGEQEIYMMPGRIYFNGLNDLNILSNNHLTRKICTRCHNRCNQIIVLQNSEKEIFCSYKCL